MKKDGIVGKGKGEVNKDYKKEEEVKRMKREGKENGKHTTKNCNRELGNRNDAEMKIARNRLNPERKSNVAMTKTVANHENDNFKYCCYS